MSRNAWIALAGTSALLLAGLLLAVLLLGGNGKTTVPTLAVVTGNPSQPFALPLADDPPTLMLAAHDADLLVFAAVKAGGPIEIAALRAETPVPSGEIALSVAGRSLSTASCGDGCARAHLSALGGKATRLSVRAGSSKVSFSLPARAPANGKAFFRRMERTMLALHSYRFVESLSSGGPPLITTWDVRAPDKLRYRTSTGGRAVIIGPSRWDYIGGRWLHQTYARLQLPAFNWDQAGHARILGRAGGLTVLVAYSQGFPAWFRLFVNPAGRVLRAEMLAESHFMFHHYSRFNQPLSITPPTRK